ncbi:hypothetical protein EYF80_000840 [Liparis tanakae]|uniref:Uncharacterized protein n=1 Tax=Liparis tanakae TaxID=230148 RepID=A0A4Z2JI72_9TELE|nr:hypothetical protein EYF80_000840 [Liparis tanakae]
MERRVWKWRGREGRNDEVGEMDRVKSQMKNNSNKGGFPMTKMNLSSGLAFMPTFELKEMV